MADLRTSLITDFSQLEQLRAEWDRLWKQDPRATAFGTFAWSRAMWRAYGPGRALCTPVVRQDDRTVCLLPVTAVEGTLCFLGDPHGDYNDALCAPDVGPEVVAAAFAALVEAPIPWRRCVLANVPETSHLFDALPLLTQQLRLLIHPAFAAQCLSADLSSGAENIVERIARKRSLNYKERKLKQMGDLQWRLVEDPGEARHHLPSFYRQHIARWALTARPSPFCRPAERTYYEAMFEELDTRRELRLFVLELDSNPIAYLVGLEAKGVLAHYRPTFHVDYWQYSPGDVLLRKVFEYARDRGLKRLDFGVGGEQYKERFATHLACNYRLSIFRSGTYGRAHMVALRAKAALKEYPVLFRAVKAAVRQTSHLLRGSRKAVQRDGIFRTALKAWRALRRSLLFAWDSVAVFAGRPGQQTPPPEDVEVTKGSLFELASVAWRHSEFWTAEKLAEARQRLRRGDTLYLAQEAGRLAHVVWKSMRREIAAPLLVGDKVSVKLGELCPVIDGLWTAAPMRAQDGQSTVLKAFLSECVESTGECWTWCASDRMPLVRALQEAGFTLRFRMHRIRLLHFLQFSWVARPVHP